ncbi:MAG: AMP-binding protein, partial [Alphaproteobacteria bacterium]
THQLIFDLQEDDVYWCTADVGWITGHSYSVYGPLANGATIVLFEGVPTYPDASRCWQIVDAHKVSIFYTAPTAIRALMQSGDTPVLETSRKSLRVLGTVGEPINTPAWRWYSQVVGEGRCPIMDTWWQTETGGVLISPLGEAGFHKPGWPQTPLPGIEPALLKSDGSVVKGAGEGALVLVDSWPGQMRSLYKDHDRFLDVYFKPYPGYYFTGDGALRDEAGHYRTTGRLDDVINVSGHRIGTAEIESAFTTHDAVVEAAVVGFPHDIKGEGIYAYLTLLPEYDHSAELEKELIQWVRNRIGPIATADVIHWAPVLPKTRSGKIMRRILRKIASHQEDQIGDTSTLADPGCVKLLIDSRK